MDGPVGGGGGFGGLQVEDLLHRVPEFRGRTIELDEIKLDQWDRKLGRFDLGEELRFKIDNLNSQYSIHDKARVAGLERVLSSTVRSAPPRTYFPEVAYWNPRVVTDADGKATVRVVIPDSSTKWKVIGRGVTRETITGRGEVEVVARHDFFVEAITPPTFIEGDRIQIRARVHCLTPYTGKIDVELALKERSKGGEGSRAQKRTVEIDGTGIVEVAFDTIEISTTGELEIEITATTRDELPDAKRRLSDAVARAIPVRPWGMRIESHAAGVARDNEVVEIELPNLKDNREYRDLRLTVAVGPSMQRWLIEEALERGARWELVERSYSSWMVTPPRTHADSASTLLGCLYVSDYVQGLNEGGAGTADMELLNGRAAGLIAQLLSAQNDDGGWGWCGRAAKSDAWATSHVSWAIGKARQDGHAVADGAVEKLTAFLKKAFSNASPVQTELKSIVLHGLSWIDEVEYAHANRLYRNRQTLSSAALGHLALTMVRLDRKSIAAELLGVLGHRLQEVRHGSMTCRKLSCDGNSAWMNSELEVTGLALLAQLSVDPRSSDVRPMVNYLAATARANGWRPHKARGTVMAAMATYYAGAAVNDAKYALEVRINGGDAGRMTSEDAESFRIDLPEDRLRQGSQRVDFSFRGRGEFAYAVTLSGFTRRFPSPRSLRNETLHVGDRYVMPPPREYEGRVVPAGFSTTTRHTWFRNIARNLTVGQVTDVRINLARYERSNNAAGDRDYVIVHETIPAGFRFLAESLTGNHVAHDYVDNVLTIYYGSRRHPSGLHYKMVATTPGTYRMPPTVIRSLYRPEIKHVNKSDQLLTVLPRENPSPDDYRMTPDELYHFGRLHHDDGDYGSSAEYLTRLLAGEWVVRDEPYRESVRMLLTAALMRDDPDGIVNYFEILKEKYPGLVIPFDQIVEIAGAYARTDQHERAYLIYRATADASFARDSAVGGTLREEGRFLESIDYLEDLWREYPDTPQVESIYYALSQTLYAKAADPDSIRPRRGDTGSEVGRVGKSAIVRETIRLLRSFLTLYPESPIADEASYSLANAYLELDDYETVVDLAAELSALFPESKWLDRFRYIEALAYFHLGSFARALEIADQVSKSTYRDRQGVERPSPNKWLALYIIGQIYHAQNETAKAIEYYKKVKSRYSDASDSVDYFEHKFVELPEATIFHPDGDVFREADEWAEHLRGGGKSSVAGDGDAGSYARPFVTIDYRNIKTAYLQVYRVDLMKLALVEKDLSRIARVNLAGIRPIVDKTVELGDGHDYVDKSMRVELDLGAGADTDEDADGDGSGAFLVICRGDHLYSTGLVLVTPLALDVQEDRAAQRVRVNVVNAISRDGLKDVHVKVIGSAGRQFVDGDSDLRGVFVADAVRGSPTAIARDSAGHFAFHRRKPVMLAMADDVPLAQNKKTASRQQQADYLSNLMEDNRRIQAANDARLNAFLKQQRSGVQVQRAE